MSLRLVRRHDRSATDTSSARIAVDRQRDQTLLQSSIFDGTVGFLNRERQGSQSRTRSALKHPNVTTDADSSGSSSPTSATRACPVNDRAAVPVCTPLLDRLERLPPPQRVARGTALGLSDSDADRSLLSHVNVGSLSRWSRVVRPRRPQRARLSPSRGLAMLVLRTRAAAPHPARAADRRRRGA
jgi:hypothetical protein